MRMRRSCILILSRLLFTAHDHIYSPASLPIAPPSVTSSAVVVVVIVVVVVVVAVEATLWSATVVVVVGAAAIAERAALIAPDGRSSSRGPTLRREMAYFSTAVAGLVARTG